jgi:hypothetical protein
VQPVVQFRVRPAAGAGERGAEGPSRGTIEPAEVPPGGRRQRDHGRMKGGAVVVEATSVARQGPCHQLEPLAQ